MMSQGYLVKLGVAIVASVLAGSATSYVTIQREQATQDSRLVSLEDLAKDQRNLTSDIRNQLGEIKADVGEIKGEVKMLAGKQIYDPKP
jgi:hypothetical protein